MEVQETNVNTNPAGEGSDLLNILENNENPPEKKPEGKPEQGNNPEGTENKDGESTDNPQAPAWTSQLPEEIRNNQEMMSELSQFGKIGDMAKAYAEQKIQMGKSIVKPDDNATAEDIQAFYENLGKPKTADGYSIDDKNAQAIKELFFKNNLTDDQAKNLYGELKQIGSKAIEQNTEILRKTAAETERNLKEKYGNQYDTKKEMLRRGIQTYGGNELLTMLKSSGLIASQKIVEMFILLGEQAQENGSIPGSAGQKSDKYIPTEKGGTFNFKYD